MNLVPPSGTVKVYVSLLKQVLTDSRGRAQEPAPGRRLIIPDRGSFVILPGTFEAIRAALAGAGELGQLVTFRVVCPVCGWRFSWEQYEHEPGHFDGLCRVCDSRCNGDAPAVVRGEPGSQAG